ncbi:hypothetical protein ACWDUX_30345 [Streptomyces sp. NPDC003444]
MRSFLAFTAFVLALMTCAYVIGHVVTEDSEKTAFYNSGFVESKLDDCEQGFQPACDWIAAK